jgi:flagellar export protein FliJ
MSDLTALIRMHRHELDEKRRALAELYTTLSALERQRRALDQELAQETAAVDSSNDVQFTYAQYVDSVRRRRAAIDEGRAQLEQKIETAKDILIEAFAEVKKYEMAQAERERRESAARALRESQTLDEIGLELFRRQEKD